jgi:outer membrane lipoprotein LolB
VSAPTVTSPKKAWPERMQELQTAQRWDLQGRAAGAVGTQGWQASLEWRQSAQVADVRLAGPLGAGAVAFKLSPQGMELNGAAVNTDPNTYLQERLGFTPPFDNLRYWLLGVPNPNQPFEFTPNALDRAAQITQDGWVIDYADYAGNGADLLPKRFTLHREQVRVRVAVDHWTLRP